VFNNGKTVKDMMGNQFALVADRSKVVYTVPFDQQRQIVGELVHCCGRQPEVHPGNTLP
jgi:hypothetical protein